MEQLLQCRNAQGAEATWADQGLYSLMASSAPGMTMDGQKWGIPYTYYNWGVYYRQDIFEDLGIAVPTNWDEFIAAGETLKANGITPITIGSKYLWTAGGVFGCRWQYRESATLFQVQCRR